MTEKQFKNRMMKRTGIDSAQCDELLKLMGEGKLFFEKDKNVRRELVSERLGVSGEKADEVNGAVSSLIKREAACKIPASLALIAAVIVVIKIFRGKKNVSENS